MSDEPDKGSEQGEVSEPAEIAAEDVVGGAETPTERQLEREQALVEEPVAESEQRIAEATEPTQAGSPAAADEADEPEAPRVKPEIPGMDLEVDLAPANDRPQYSEEFDPDAPDEEDAEDEDELLAQPIANASINLAADARYRATGKRKTAVARVTLRPGSGKYTINGRTLEVFFPRATLQRTIRQPLETVGFEEKMDVVATMHGGGVSAQADALRHGISRALLEADPNLRGELKRRGFLTRDARAKERKKAGLKKARKRPQFSKR
jgi:small subunit ribosomal protein S9